MPISTIGSDGLASSSVTQAKISSGSVTSTQLATAVQPIGVGQTWQNLIGSRTSGTTYTNSTGRPIFVSIQINTNASGAAYVNFSVDGTNFGYWGQGSGGSPSTLYSTFCTQVIPSGSTYTATSTGNVTIAQWFELR